MIEIDIATGAASWPYAKPLFETVWPADVIKTLPWGHLQFAHADLRVFIETEGDVLCHVGICRRTGTWNGRKVNIGGSAASLRIPTTAAAAMRPSRLMPLSAPCRTKARSTSACCSASRTTAHFMKSWDGRRSTAISTRNSQGRARFDQFIGRDVFMPYVFKIRRLLREGTIDLCGLPW